MSVNVKFSQLYGNIGIPLGIQALRCFCGVLSWIAYCVTLFTSFTIQQKLFLNAEEGKHTNKQNTICQVSFKYCLVLLHQFESEGELDHDVHSWVSRTRETDDIEDVWNGMNWWGHLFGLTVLLLWQVQAVMLQHYRGWKSWRTLLVTFYFLLVVTFLVHEFLFFIF